MNSRHNQSASNRHRGRALRILTCLLAILGVALAAPASLAQETHEAYRLKANDVIFVSVFGEADLSKEVQLTISGEASLPLIGGGVVLAGLTLKEAEDKITGLYKPDYLVEPRITVNLANAADERVTVMGAVMRPGQVMIPPETTLDLVGAIDSAGGLAPQADADRVELKRGDTVKNFALDDLRKEGAAQIMLVHGDRVNVPTSPFANTFVTVIGEVGNPGQITFPNNGVLDVATAVALAGNLGPEADPGRITVKRAGRTFSASLNGGGGRLVPGDVVEVGRSPFAGQTVTVMGKVASPGQVAFPLNGQLDLLGAIAMAGGFDRLANQKKVTVSRLGPDGTQSWTFDVTDMQEGKVAKFALRPNDTVSVPVRRF